MAFLNGERIPFAELRIPVYDLGLMQGATLTERLRTVRHQPYLVREHLDRLTGSLDTIGWKIPFDRAAFSQMIHQLAEENTRGLSPEVDLAIVLFITAGQSLGDANEEIDSSQPTVCLYSAPLPFGRWAAWSREGVPLVVSKIRQISSRSLDPRIKHRSRLHWNLADQEAHLHHPRAMALLLDEEGGVTETSSGNLFVVRDGALLTPHEEFTLPGIAQAKVIQLAKSIGIPVRRIALTVEDVASADEAFLTSSTYSLLPVSTIDGETIGKDRPGEITSRLTAAWCREIGLDFVKQALEAGQHC